MTNAIKGAVQSFYSGAFYGELARRGKGIGMRFVLLLTLVLVVLYMSVVFLGSHFEISTLLAQLPEKADSLPALTFADGKLSIDKPVPYRIDLGSAPDDMWVVIDTGYKITDINALEKYMEENKIFFLVTADKLVSRDISKRREGNAIIDNQLKISDLKDSGPFNVTHAQWKAMAETIKSWGMSLLVLVLFVSLFFGLFIINLIATVFAAVIVMILDLFAKTGLEFAAAMRLASAAHIPICIIGVLPMLAGHNGLSGLADWLLWLLYLIFAVWAVKLYSKHAAG